MVAADVQADIVRIAILGDHRKLGFRNLRFQSRLVCDQLATFSSSAAARVVGPGSGSISVGGGSCDSEKTISSTAMWPSRLRSTISK